MNVLIIGLGGVTHTFRHWPERILALALARRGHTVWSIGTHDPNRPALANQHETIDGVEVYRVRPAYSPNIALGRALNHGPRPDIVHLMHPRNVLAAQATAWAKQHGIPTVYTWLGPFHDSYLSPDRERPYEAPATYERLAFTRKAMLRQAILERNPREAIRNYRLHAPLRQANGLLPCSEFEAMVMRRFGLTQPQTVVPLWIDVPFIESIPPAPFVPTVPPSHNQEIIPPRPWLLFVGQLTPRKGYDLAIHALPSILAAYPTASLLIVSGINQARREHTLQLARQAGVAGHIHILGYLSDADLINLYRSADVLLFPTRFEGFGLPLLEAMAAHCPIVTTDIPVVNEIVQHGDNGLLVPYGNAEALAQAALSILADPPLRERLLAGGLATVTRRYDESRLIEHIELAYQQYGTVAVAGGQAVC
jgi:glycosyltransferase involved in cell wall biosynthesis